MSWTFFLAFLICMRTSHGFEVTCETEYSELKHSITKLLCPANCWRQHSTLCGDRVYSRGPVCLAAMPDQWIDGGGGPVVVFRNPNSNRNHYSGGNRNAVTSNSCSASGSSYSFEKGGGFVRFFAAKSQQVFIGSLSNGIISNSSEEIGSAFSFTNKDECEGSPCMYGGTCMNGLEEHFCLCRPLNTGKNCEIELIGHDSEVEIEADNCALPQCYKRKVNYDVEMDEIVELIERSQHCRQFIKYRRQASNLLKGDHGVWLSRNGSVKHTWGGSETDYYCACGVTGTCIIKTLKCNCGINNNTMTSDEGYLTNKDDLPVTEMRFGDTDARIERGWHTLGKLECWSD